MFQGCFVSVTSKLQEDSEEEEEVVPRQDIRIPEPNPDSAAKYQDDQFEIRASGRNVGQLLVLHISAEEGFR